MTKISFESPVVRETDSLYKTKPIVIEPTQAIRCFG
jgi:hypothetical protein